MNSLSNAVTGRRGRLLAAAALFVWSAHACALEPGKPAPGFELNGLDGAVRLDKYQGKLVYLDFWASWCGPCRQSFPWMNEMQAKYGAQGLQVIGVSLDARTDDARGFLATTPARFVVAFDPNGLTPRNYGIRGMPSSVLIGPDGKVVFEHAGFREADRAELENRIKSALGARK
jgi:thiol-disulfide isomerase/thioredoxin